VVHIILNLLYASIFTELNIWPFLLYIAKLPVSGGYCFVLRVSLYHSCAQFHAHENFRADPTLDCCLLLVFAFLLMSVYV